MTPEEYFNFSSCVNKKRYDALHSYFVDRLPAEDAAQKHGYRLSSFYSLTRDFRAFLKENEKEDFFFKDTVLGRKPGSGDDLKELIISLRKKNNSIEDIVALLNSKSYDVGYRTVYNVLHEAGFSRLPRRDKVSRKQLELPPLKAPVAEKIDWEPEKFFSSHTGLFAFLPVLFRFGIHRIIERSSYPFTRTVNRMSSILCFLALKLSNVKRYSHDDIWCMDRGLGLFAGLNVLPKTAWYSSCSSRVESGMNLSFLKELHKVWASHGLLSDTSNLDFTTIPDWGEDDHLENNWSGKRGKALSSMLAVLAQDPESGIIDYGNCNVMHRDEPAVVLEYLDFYRTAPDENNALKYLVFDSKFTNYQNLSTLDEQQIKFITIRRRGSKMLEKIEKITTWKTIRVEQSGLKKRTLKVYEQHVTLPGYTDPKTGEAKTIRQVIITGNGKIKPAVMLTNDFDLPLEAIVRKYSRRWLVEKGIAQQIDFFHLNRVSSSMVIKVDFDLVMSILAHNLYRLLAMSLDRYHHFSDERIYEKFVQNSGEIEIGDIEIRINLKKNRELPLLLDFFKQSKETKYTWMKNKKVHFYATATS
jgi:predicted transport protein